MQAENISFPWLRAIYTTMVEKLKNADILELDNQPEKIFFLCSLLFGLFSLFITPPFQAPDEYGHFFRAVYTSEGGIIGNKANIPVSLYELSQTFPIDFLPHQSQNKQDKEAIIKEFSKPFTKTPLIEVNINNTIFYTPLGYITSSIGIKTGILLRLSPISIFYLGRLFNFLFWIFIVLSAIHVTPIHKLALVLIALTPMMLFQAASLSTDALLNSLCLLFGANFLSIVCDTDQKIKFNQILLFTFLALAIVLCKQIYGLFAGLLLFIPISRFGSLKRYMIINFVSLSLIAFTAISWYSFVSPQFIPENTGSIPSVQLLTIKNNPFQYASLFVKTVIEQGEWWKKMFIGILGWIDTPLPNYVYATYLIAIAVTSIVDSRKDINLPAFQRLGLLSVFFLIGVAVITSMFINWTPIGSDLILGVQGRYFIPIAFPLFLQLYNNKFFLLKPILSPILFLYIIVISASMIYSLFIRYYI